MTRILFFLGTILLLTAISENAVSHASGTISRSADDSLHQSSGYNYEVSFYDLSIRLFPETKTIKGNNTLHIKRNANQNSIRVDLSNQLDVTGVTMHNESCPYRHKNNIIKIHLPEKKRRTPEKLTIQYRGSPASAKDPPWEGGFIWDTDSLNRPWVSVACQFEGASTWWPCKDTLAAKPDSMRITGTIPAGMAFISNGKNIYADTGSASRHKYQWKVQYPINLYNVSFYAGHYRNIKRSFTGRHHAFPLSFYVLPNNVNRARHHFKQVKPYLSFLESTYGPYPFPRDGYKLVQAPYWGMEHQTAIAYGHDFTNNSFGFDFIIVHETAHEYWGNSISAQSLRHLWIHEAFATYTEALYVEKTKGYPKALEYLGKLRKSINNNQPVFPYYRDTSHTRDNDMYFKGAWMLHTLRNVLNNDKKWFKLLKKLYQEHQYSIVSSEEIIRWLTKHTGKDLKPFFKTYLEQASVPVFNYYIKEKGRQSIIFYRWEQTAHGFSMPVELTINGKAIRKKVTNEWQQLTVPGKTDSVNVADDKFLIKVEQGK